MLYCTALCYDVGRLQTIGSYRGFSRRSYNASPNERTEARVESDAVCIISDLLKLLQFVCLVSNDALCFHFLSSLVWLMRSGESGVGEKPSLFLPSMKPTATKMKKTDVAQLISFIQKPTESTFLKFLCEDRKPIETWEKKITRPPTSFVRSSSVPSTD